jgi:hypothetical protein
VVTWIVEKVQDSVAVPDPVTLFGVTEHTALLADRLTAPPNPLIDETVMIEDPATPVFTLTVAGLAVTVKSSTV